MKAGKKHNALEVIKKEQLKRRVFTLEFKAEVVRHKKAENLTFAECGRKFDVLPKLVQQWEKQYEGGQLTQAAGRERQHCAPARQRWYYLSWSLQW